MASLLALVVSTGVAAAHAKLESMTPANGSSMAAPPTQVVLTFNEPVGSNGTQVVVRSPGGKDVATGDAQVIDNKVTQPVGAMVEAGKYRVDARVVSADGHPVIVSGSFTVTHAGHPATASLVLVTKGQVHLSALAAGSAGHEGHVAAFDAVVAEER